MIQLHEPMFPVCQIDLFGGLKVTLDDRVIDRFQTTKTAALLGYVALHLGRSYRRDYLAELLWPDGDAVAIRNRLNQAVSSLRRQLHPPELSSSHILLANHHSISLNAAAVRTDLSEFQSTFRQASTSRDRKERARALEKAVSLYTGPLLSGFNEDWLVADRLQADEQFGRAVDELIRIHSRTGNPEKALEFAMLHLKNDPSDEEAHLMAIELLLRADNVKAAARQYNEMTSLVYGGRQEPSEAARALLERIQREQRSSSGKLPRAATYSKLPEDEEAPIRVSERPSTTPKTKLPRYLTSFVGRHFEVDLIRSRTVGGTRIVTLLGLAGTGKTRLAVEYGWSLATITDTIVRFISLSNKNSLDRCVAEIYSAITDSPATADASIRQVSDVLRDVGPMLLIIDNIDDLAPKIAPTISEIIQHSNNITILCTSRQPLQITGELMITLNPLPVENLEQMEDLEKISRNPAVRLFVERSQAVRPDFQVTERTRNSVVNLCQKLDGIPLAIELAAGWTRTLTPQQILDNVEAQSGFLESRRKDIAPRHRSMRAAIESSFNNLVPSAQQTFLRASIFDSTFARDALLAICPSDSLDEDIASLLDHSMLTSDASEEVPRFKMLETLKQFAKENLTNAQVNDLSFTHAEYYVQRVETLLDASVLASSIHPDYGDILNALRWLIEHGQSEKSARVIRPLLRYWEATSRLQEGLNWIDLLTDRDFDGLRKVQQAHVLASKGRLLWLKGEYDLFLPTTKKALSLFSEANADSESMRARFDLIADYHRLKQYDLVLPILEESEEIAKKSEDEASIARLSLMRGNMNMELENYEAAEESYRLCSETARRSGSLELQTSAMTNIANLCIREEHWEKAQHCLKLAMETAQQVGVRWILGMVMLIRAKLETAVGDNEAALKTILDAFPFSVDTYLVLWRLTMQAGLIAERLGLNFEAARLLAFTAYHGGAHVEKNFNGLEFRPYYEAMERIKQELPASALKEQRGIGELMSTEEIKSVIESVLESLYHPVSE